MPKATYALERGGGDALEISYRYYFHNIEVRLNGNLIGTIPDKKKLDEGQIFQLPDGTALSVQLVKTWLSSSGQLRVLRNGKPLSEGPSSTLAGSVFFIYFIAFLNIVLGCIASILQVELLQALGFGIFSIIMGVMFLVLGFFTQRRFLIALIIALIIWGLDSALAFLNSVQPLLDGSNSVATLISNSEQLVIGDILVSMVLLIAILILRVAFLIVIGKGVGAINKLKKGTLPAVS